TTAGLPTSLARPGGWPGVRASTQVVLERWRAAVVLATVVLATVEDQWSTNGTAGRRALVLSGRSCGRWTPIPPPYRDVELAAGTAGWCGGRWAATCGALRQLGRASFWSGRAAHGRGSPRATQGQQGRAPGRGCGRTPATAGRCSTIGSRRQVGRWP